MKMEAKRIKTYTSVYPAVKFIGIRYGEEDRKDGTSGHP